MTPEFPFVFIGGIGLTCVAVAYVIMFDKWGRTHKMFWNKKKSEPKETLATRIEKIKDDVVVMAQREMALRIEQIRTVRAKQREAGLTPCYCEREIPRFSEHCWECTENHCTARVHMFRGSN